MSYFVPMIRPLLHRPAGLSAAIQHQHQQQRIRPVGGFSAAKRLGGVNGCPVDAERRLAKIAELAGDNNTCSSDLAQLQALQQTLACNYFTINEFHRWSMKAWQLYAALMSDYQELKAQRVSGTDSMIAQRIKAAEILIEDERNGGKQLEAAILVALTKSKIANCPKVLANEGIAQDYKIIINELTSALNIVKSIKETRTIQQIIYKK